MKRRIYWSEPPTDGPWDDLGYSVDFSSVRSWLRHPIDTYYWWRAWQKLPEEYRRSFE